jgi:hypothetical protein
MTHLFPFKIENDKKDDIRSYLGRIYSLPKKKKKRIHGSIFDTRSFKNRSVEFSQHLNDA